MEPHDHAREGAPSRFTIAGPQVSCGEHALNGMALIFHELATNAVKYGALTRDGGRISVTWRMEGEKLVFAWVETGGPELKDAPEMTGFGSKLLNDMVTRQFAGTLERAWEQEGLAVRISMDAKTLAA